MGLEFVRLTPSRATQVLEGYDVDRVVLEASEEGEVTDFRIELGRAYEVLWLVPIRPNGHLRLIHICYLTCEEDPQLRMDPCAVDFGPEEWSGELARIGDRVVEHVRIELTRSPPAYRCTARVRQPDGASRTYALVYLSVAG